MKDRPRKTRRSWNEPGHAHYLTYSCYRRLPLLSRNRVRRWVVDALQRMREELDVALWAYVIMPEHVHVLLHPRAAHYEIRRILAVLKQPVAKAARKWLEENRHTAWLERLTVVYASRRVFRFWQPGGGFDHNVFREKTVPAIVDYIHANPVRRKLVDHPTEWEWVLVRDSHLAPSATGFPSCVVGEDSQEIGCEKGFSHQPQRAATDG